MVYIRSNMSRVLCCQYDGDDYCDLSLMGIFCVDFGDYGEDVVLYFWCLDLLMWFFHVLMSDEPLQISLL